MNGTTTETTVSRLLRELAPQVLGAVARRHGDFDAAEDAVQEALVLCARLEVLLDMGLGYLSIERSTPTLSPGEL